MSRLATPKQHDSLSIEEFSQQPGHHQQNWLLTYVDVFVLIVMLLLTLITLSNFDTEQKAKKQPLQHIKKLPHKNTPARTNFEPEPLNFDQEQVLVFKEIITPVFGQDHTTVANEIKKFRNSKSHDQTESILQKQLTNTVNELGLVDSINIKVEQNYAQLEIHDKILFTSSETTLLETGKTLLKKITPLLKQSTGLIYIEGHTDNRPINTDKFPSNWELGAARATSVLHFLSSQEMEDTRLTAVTYGDTKPIADNLTAKGREKNRRVSILIKVSDKID